MLLENEERDASTERGKKRKEKCIKHYTLFIFTLTRIHKYRFSKLSSREKFGKWIPKIRVSGVSASHNGLIVIMNTFWEK